MSGDFERKSLFRITYPLFLYALMSVAVTFADTALVSNYSENLAAAVSLANQVLGVAYDLSALLSVGALVLISQYLGRGEVEAARRMGVIALAAGMALGLGIAGVVVIGAETFAGWVNTPPEILPDVLIYIYVIACALVFHGFIMSAQAALTGFGMTLPILVIGVAANVIYLGLEYTLIYGAFGLPELGVYGAAWATVIVRGGTILMLLVVLQRQLKFRLTGLPRGALPDMWRMLRISYPSVAENLAYNLYQLTVVSMIAALGVSAVLTRSYALTTTQLIMIISLVISHGNQVLVGYDKGGGDAEAAFRRGLRTALWTGAAGMAAAALLYALAEPIVGVLSRDADIIASVRDILFLQICVTPLNTINLILFNALKACGDVNRPVIASLILTFAVALPLAYIVIVMFGLGVVGLWYVYIVEEALKAAAMFWLWRGRGWVTLDVLSTNPQGTPGGGQAETPGN